MTREQFEALKKWMVAIVDEKTSHASSDGGLIESRRLFEVEHEAKALFVTTDDD